MNQKLQYGECKPDTVNQPGIITRINGDVIEILITSRSACSTCHAQGFCSALESKNKTIEVKHSAYPDAKVGDKVYVGVHKSMGSKAVLIAYFVPFVVLLASLLIMTRFMAEGLAGLSALGVTGLYYLFIYLFRNRLKNQFEFSLSGRED